MASVAFFVRFVALMLLVVSIVYCDLVGHGGHELVNGKIVKLRGNTKIAEKPEDLELYKNMPGSCDVEMDKDGNITIWYLKNSKTTKEGCSIDFAMPDLSARNFEFEFPMYFGIQHNKELTDCLSDMGFVENTRLDNESAITSNLLPFSFSLKNGEFDGVKRGYPERHKNFCGDVLKCYNKGGKCLDVADYSIGWARNGDYVSSTIQQIGEYTYWICDKGMEHTKREIVYPHYFDNEMELTSCLKIPRSYSCFKRENIREPKRWEIKDRDHTDTLFNHLYTFHILPTTSMQTSMQKIWIKCNEDADKEDCNENAAFQQCDKMFVKFPYAVYKMLVPDDPVKQTTTGVGETTTMVECPPCVISCPAVNCSNVIQNLTKKVEIKSQNGPETKKDSKKTLQITLVIVGSIILLLMFTALLICLFVSKSK
ncbi:unnamed protein product [Meloidogyne enterolobii]|uniref:Uncharacterized protein n=1 Tax=Meloidogyne enterolobii TaxID=390850 RepID=A0ACB0Z640_MELEN